MHGPFINISSISKSKLLSPGVHWSTLLQPLVISRTQNCYFGFWRKKRISLSKNISQLTFSFNFVSFQLNLMWAVAAAGHMHIVVAAAADAECYRNQKAFCDVWNWPNRESCRRCCVIDPWNRTPRSSRWTCRKKMKDIAMSSRGMKTVSGICWGREEGRVGEGSVGSRVVTWGGVGREGGGRDEGRGRGLHHKFSHENVNSWIKSHSWKFCDLTYKLPPSIVMPLSKMTLWLHQRISCHDEWKIRTMRHPKMFIQINP